MARFGVDFNKVDDKKFEALPPGNYTLKVSEARMETAKTSGELKETVVFEVVDGPNGSPQYAGRKVWTSYSLQASAAFRIKKLLTACGFPTDQLNEVDDQQLIGCVIRATLTVETYNGNQNNRVNNESPLTAPAAAAGAAVPAPSFPAPTGFAAPPGAVPAPSPMAMPTPPAPPAPQAPGTWAPQWGAPAPAGVPQQGGFQGATPTPPPPKPVG